MYCRELVSRARGWLSRGEQRPGLLRSTSFHCRGMVSETGGSGVVITPIPPWAGDPEPLKNHWRPPDYNAEDYVTGLMSKRSGGPPSPPAKEEMSLRSFASLSDLLAKLAVDLRVAYPSFVQEFVSPCLDGCSQLLETLRSVQTNTAAPRRQILTDELACLQCLSACFRAKETPTRLAQASAGLFSLAACVMSNLNKSRILALQILTKVCEEAEAGKGFGPVSDALSTLRLRFGEPVRFKFLCGMLSGASPELLQAGLAFINSFLESAPEAQARVYIQAELSQAGFQPEHIAKTLSTKVPCIDSIRCELNRWNRLHVDVKKLKSREGELVKEVHILKDKLKMLERKLQVLENEKSEASRSESRLKSRCSELERQVSSLRGSGVPGASSPAEDEGISSSGQDDSAEREPLIYEMYSVDNVINSKINDEEETTIDEVIEELQNIINDAESDIKDKKDPQKEKEVAKYYSKYLQRSANDISNSSLDNTEAEIVPVKLIPYPPRRARSLYFDNNLYGNNQFFEECDTDDSDSLLSASNGQVSYQHQAQQSGRPSKEHLELLQREAQKSYVRRRETFHYPAQMEEQSIEIRPEIKNRRGSLDGVFPYNDISPKGTRIYIDGSSSGESQEKRLLSKSLDRIRDGLDTMVDIVVTEDMSRSYQQPPPPIVRPVPMQRSTQMNPPKNIYSMMAPKKTEESSRYVGDRTVFLPIRDDPTPAIAQQTFLLKRAPCLNAGLYSGQEHQPQVAQPQQPVVTTNINISDYYNKSLNGLNLSVSGKLTDLPSGLY